MPDRTFPLSRLEVGEPLPCDVRDANGMLLLREGRAARSDKQLDTLMRHGAWGKPALPAADDPKYRTRSPLAQVLAARHHLQALFADPSPTTFVSGASRIVDEVRKACRANADLALASILLCRDEPYAIRHPVDVAIASYITGRAMQLDAATLASTAAAALTMNIGMLELQEQLQALPGGLNQAQRMQVEGHCERGAVMLHEYGVTDHLWLEIVRDHHERPDGSGYPARKSGDQLGVATQLVSLADVYCARVSERQYRPAMQSSVALRWLFLNEGATLDEQYAAMFIKTLGIYPPGTGVRLQSGSIGVVTHRGGAGHKPRVASITNPAGMRLANPIRHHDDDAGHAVAEVVDLAELGLKVNMESLWGADGAG